MTKWMSRLWTLASTRPPLTRETTQLGSCVRVPTSSGHALVVRWNPVYVLFLQIGQLSVYFWNCSLRGSDWFNCSNLWSLAAFLVIVRPAAVPLPPCLTSHPQTPRCLGHQCDFFFLFPFSSHLFYLIYLSPIGQRARRTYTWHSWSALHRAYGWKWESAGGL